MKEIVFVYSFSWGGLKKRLVLGEQEPGMSGNLGKRKIWYRTSMAYFQHLSGYGRAYVLGDTIVTVSKNKRFD